MADSSPGGTPSPSRAAMIALAYLWLLAFVPLLIERNDPEVQWHAKHGIVLMAAELMLWLALAFVTTLLSFSLVTLGLGCVLSLFGIFLWVAVLALHVAAIVKGVSGGRLIIPGVSEYADKM